MALVGARLEYSCADAAHHQMIDAPGILERGGERDVRAHREAQQMRALDAGMIHQREDIARHRSAAVLRRIVRLGAFAMAAIVEGQAAHPLALDRVVPADALPVLIAVGGKTMDQDHGRPRVARAEIVVGEREAVGSELSHNFP